MERPRARAWALVGAALVAAALVLVACGDAAQTVPDPTPTSHDTRTVTLPPVIVGSGSTAAATGPTFPAETPADVLALADQRPDQKVTYDVATADGSGIELTVARKGDAALVTQTTGDGATIAVGVDVGAGTVAFTCTGSPLACKDGDPGKRGLKVLQRASVLLGGSAIAAAFAPLATQAADQVGVGPDEEAGQDVSCLAGSAAGGDLRLCVTEQGVITEVRANGQSMVATTVADSVETADVERPDQPGAAAGTTTDDGGQTAGDETAGTPTVGEGAATDTSAATG